MMIWTKLKFFIMRITKLAITKLNHKIFNYRKLHEYLIIVTNKYANNIHCYQN
jgi:hypothetical protein